MSCGKQSRIRWIIDKMMEVFSNYQNHQKMGVPIRVRMIYGVIYTQQSWVRSPPFIRMWVKYLGPAEQVFARCGTDSGTYGGHPRFKTPRKKGGKSVIFVSLAQTRHFGGQTYHFLHSRCFLGTWAHNRDFGGFPRKNSHPSEAYISCGVVVLSF